MRFIQKAFAALLIFTFVTCASARTGFAPRAVFLGAAQVDGRFDHDTIRVRTEAGAFRAIQLGVHGGTVDFHRVVVRYVNGSHEIVPSAYRIPHGGRTRPITLSRPRGAIRSVELWYSKAHWRAHPRVAVYGYR